MRFAYESQDQSGQWRRSYGNENWEFDENGLMRQRHASINDLPILESERLFRWPLGRRPDEASRAVRPGSVNAANSEILLGGSRRYTPEAKQLGMEYIKS